jgi:uncharacterized UPF0160 family protein
MSITIGEQTYERGLTHPGTFHADEVFASAILRIVDPGFPIERKIAGEEPPTTLVFDQSRPSENKQGRFDHHDKNAPKRNDGTPYSSFGLVFDELADRLFDDDRDAFGFEKQIVIPIDLQDNGLEWNILSQLISDIQTESGSTDEAFWKAEVFAEGIVRRRIGAMNKSRRSYNYVLNKLYEQSFPEILVLEQWEPGWQKAFDEYDTSLICGFPSARAGWAAQAARVSSRTQSRRISFPAEWRALSDEALQKASGVSDATFCHKDAFLATARTKEGAIQLARLAIEHKKHEQMLARQEQMRYHVIAETQSGDVIISRHKKLDAAISNAEYLSKKIEEGKWQPKEGDAIALVVGKRRSRKQLRKMRKNGEESPYPYDTHLRIETSQERNQEE